MIQSRSRTPRTWYPNTIGFGRTDVYLAFKVARWDDIQRLPTALNTQAIKGSELRAWTNLDLKPTLDTFSIQRLHDHSKIVKTLGGYCRDYDTLGISRHLSG